MPVARKSIAELRSDLAQRFPTAQRTLGRTLQTGVPAIDDAAGGLPIAAITEIVCAAPSCGGHLLLGQLLATTRASRARVALVDSTDSFDPGSYDPGLLAHLVWVRCAGTAQALSATDLLARDANLALVFLDLRRAPEAELRRIPGPQWYRLQRAVEPTDLALVIETPRPSVPSAQVRFNLRTSHRFSALDCERAHLSASLAPTIERQRVAIAAAS
jgi:hypothetical protein